VLFNHRYELVHEGVDLQAAPELESTTYAIGGTTALLDAVGMTIDSVRNRIAGLPEAERPAGVIVAILTDGLENSSREYTRQEVFDRIRQQQAEGWEFVFLAANQDAVQEGGTIGIPTQDARAYAHSGEGVREAWSGISRRTSRSRQRARKRRKPGSGSNDRSPIGFKGKN